MEYIYIKNEKTEYSKWKIKEYIETEEGKYNFYNICLDRDKSIISTISEWKVYKSENKLYSDHVIDTSNSLEFAFTPFGSIKI